jgi:predicted nucleic acid-binding protein
VIAYVDASVVLRIVLGQPGQLESWPDIERAISSELVRVECLRSVDRTRIAAGLGEGVASERRAGMLKVLDGLELISLEPSILERAADPFPTSLGTLDALHLATALAIRDQVPEVVLATHDVALGQAAAAMGLEVHGLD